MRRVVVVVVRRRGRSSRVGKDEVGKWCKCEMEV